MNGVSERARPLREPAIWLLLATVVAHVIRRNAVDVVVFLGTAVLILLDDRGTPRAGPWRPRVTRFVALAVSAGYALAVLPMSRTGPAMRVVIAIPGLVLLAVVVRTWGHRAVPAPSPAGRGRLVWPGLLVSLAVYELYNFAHQPGVDIDSWAHPTISALVDPLLAGHVVRAVAAGLWLAGGFWLVRLMSRCLDVPAGPTEASRREPGREEEAW